MADTCLLSLPSLFTTTTSPTTKHSLSLPSKLKNPTNLLFSISNSSLSFKLKEKQPHFINLTAFVSQTSDWGQQDEDSNSVVTVSESEEESKWGNEGGFEAETEAVADVFEFVGVEESEDVGGSEGIGEESDGFVEPPEEAKIFVGNLPYDIDSEKLAMLFEQAGTVEIAEVIYNRETDSSRGFGFVTMSTVEDAEKAVNMFDGYDMQGRLLTVNKAAPRGARPERRPRVSQPGYRIYVGNLPWEVDNARLEQVFSEHGKVVEARVVYERESGRSRGFGFVTMSSETELNDAIAALDGQSLDGRAIRVNVAEERPRRF